MQPKISLSSATSSIEPFRGLGLQNGTEHHKILEQWGYIYLYLKLACKHQNLKQLYKPTQIITDKLTKNQRSYDMSKMGSKGTKSELIIKSALTEDRTFLPPKNIQKSGLYRQENENCGFCQRMLLTWLPKTLHNT